MAGTIFSRITQGEPSIESTVDDNSTEGLSTTSSIALGDTVDTIFNYFCLTGAVSALLVAIFLVFSPRLRIPSGDS